MCSFSFFSEFSVVSFRRFLGVLLLRIFRHVAFGLRVISFNAVEVLRLWFITVVHVLVIIIRQGVAVPHVQFITEFAVVVIMQRQSVAVPHVQFITAFDVVVIMQFITVVLVPGNMQWRAWRCACAVHYGGSRPCDHAVTSSSVHGVKTKFATVAWKSL